MQIEKKKIKVLKFNSPKFKAGFCPIRPFSWRDIVQRDFVRRDSVRRDFVQRDFVLHPIHKPLVCLWVGVQ